MDNAWDLVLNILLSAEFIAIFVAIIITVRELDKKDEDEDNDRKF